VLIDALRGREAAGRLRDLRGEGSPPYVCAINVEEVWRGAGPDEEEAVRRLLGALRIAPLGRAEGERAGRWRARFAAAGTTLAQANCLIAAAALGVGARLATGNAKDFPMAELEVERWPVG
jgi:predicted nucleic acid-binding protein